MTAARVALVTGASRGIGRATACALAAAGHRVAVTYRSDAEAAKSVVADVEAAGGDAIAVACDVADPATVDAAVGEVEDRLGPVAVLVANAGVTADGLVARMTEDRWRSVLATDLDGAFWSIRRVVPGMMRARWGRIVTVSSVVALSGSGGQANYAAAKAGLIGLTRSLARELAPRAITCNVVAPGPIATEMVDALPEARRSEITAAVPLGRMGTAGEVAATVAFLASDAAAYTTGAVLPVDGGLGMGH
ncbi:MAG: 3-oxoacyl-ACP reductase FabG [Actinobacteria bacterium]|nr:3-oxoacyl-ACP reductase FabG [Actinomycetota bacterium]